MELVDGCTLREWLKEERTTKAILETMLAAGRGLSAAHAAGIVHRDFKPHNVLVRRDGRAVVTDFGIAVPAIDALPSGQLVGTPAYMAPEQYLGEPIGERTDQFSFSIALFEALHGERPFRTEDDELPPA